MSAKTLYDKLWDSHLVKQRDDGSALLYIDRHLLHEVTSPQAFEGLRLAGRKPWRIDANLATPDHNVPTTNPTFFITATPGGLIHEAISQLGSRPNWQGRTDYRFFSAWATALPISAVPTRVQPSERISPVRSP